MKTRRIGTWAQVLDHVAGDVSRDSCATQADVVRVIDSLRDLIGGLRVGRSLLIPGLGTFRRVTRKARRVRNPATGELMMLPASSTIAFRAAKAVRG